MSKQHRMISLIIIGIFSTVLNVRAEDLSAAPQESVQLEASDQDLMQSSEQSTEQISQQGSDQSSEQSSENSSDQSIVQNTDQILEQNADQATDQTIERTPAAESDPVAESAPAAEITPVSESTYPDDPVVVENRPYVWDASKSEYRLPYYRYRRGRYGLYFQAGIHQYNPQVVRDQQTLLRRATRYQGTVPSTFEVQMSPRIGTSLGAISLDLAYSEYQVKAIDDSDAMLNIKLPRVGISITFDTFFREPYVAPYISAGVYQAQYRQQDNMNGGKVKDGNSEVTPYYAVGILFQTNWIDSGQAGSAYEELGLENTYLFAEGRTYAGTETGDIPNLGSDTVLACGVRLEF